MTPARQQFEQAFGDLGLRDSDAAWLVFLAGWNAALTKASQDFEHTQDFEHIVWRHIDKHFRLFEEFARMTEKTEQPTPQTENKNWRGIPDSEIIEILRDYNMVPSPNRMEYTKEIIRTLMERNT